MQDDSKPAGYELSLTTDELVRFRGRLTEVVERVMFGGTQVMRYEIARRPPGVRLIFDDGPQVLLTKEFRAELDGFDLRLPGGKVFDSAYEHDEYRQSGQPVMAAARAAAVREAREETGLQPLELNLLGVSKCGATVEWDLYFFKVASWRDLEQGQHLEAGENIDVVWTSKAEALARVMDGSVSEDRSAMQLLRYLHRSAALAVECRS